MKRLLAVIVFAIVVTMLVAWWLIKRDNIVGVDITPPRQPSSGPDFNPILLF